MKKFVLSMLTVLLTVFFVSSTVQAQTSTCPAVDKEELITAQLKQSPELLVAILEKDTLNHFFVNLKNTGLMVGELQVDKIYIFKSEHHPESVYVFFLQNHCIVDVKMTFKSLVERLLNG